MKKLTEVWLAIDSFVVRCWSRARKAYLVVRQWFFPTRAVCVDCRFHIQKELGPEFEGTLFDLCTHEQHRSPVDGTPDHCDRYNHRPENHAKCPYFKRKFINGFN